MPWQFRNPMNNFHCEDEELLKMDNAVLPGGGIIFRTMGSASKLVRQRKALAKYKSYGQLVLEKLEKQVPDKIIWIQAETEFEVDGKVAGERIRNIACALLDTYDLKAQSVFMIKDKNTVDQCLFKYGVICAGGLTFYTYPDEDIDELVRQARLLEPTFYVCRSEHLEQLELLESKLGYKLKRIIMDEDADEDDKSSFNYLIDYDWEISKSKSSVPYECKRSIYHEVADLVLTAGTTGPPKIVAISHSRLLYDGVEISRYPINVSVISAAVMNCYLNQQLVAGAVVDNRMTVVLLNYTTPADYLETIEKFKISAIYMGPVTMCQVMEEDRMNPGKYNLKSLRYGQAVGMKMNFMSQIFRFAVKHMNYLRAWRHTYVMTEISKVSARNEPAIRLFDEVEDCGPLVRGMQVKIIDLDKYGKSGEFVPLGYYQIGLITVKCSTSFRGYYDKPYMRQKHNIAPLPEPFPDTVRPYREDNLFDPQEFFITNDVGYMNPKNNRLYVEGRREEIIKIHDKPRLTPYEVEKFLYHHRSVFHAVVFGVKGKRRNREYLRAIVQLHSRVVPLKTKQELEYWCDFDDKAANWGWVQEKCMKWHGTNKLSSMEDSMRRYMQIRINGFFMDACNTEFRLLGGIGIVDEIPLLRDTGKPDKDWCKSLGLDQIEFYGQHVHDGDSFSRQ